MGLPVVCGPCISPAAIGTAPILPVLDCRHRVYGMGTPRPPDPRSCSQRKAARVCPGCARFWGLPVRDCAPSHFAGGFLGRSDPGGTADSAICFGRSHAFVSRLGYRGAGTELGHYARRITELLRSPRSLVDARIRPGFGANLPAVLLIGRFSAETVSDR